MTATLQVRPFVLDDEEAVIELLRTSLGPGPSASRTAEFFRWKHRDNPLGRSLMLVAEDGDSIVGFRAFMRWRFASQEGEVTAVRAVDTATHPAHQRRGIFSRLTMEALDALREEGVDLIFNTPNDKSLPGYLKMGWSEVGRIPVMLRPRHPGRVLAEFRKRSHGTPSGPPPEIRAPRAGEALCDTEGLTHLLYRQGSVAGFATPRTVEYLRWRYCDAPGLGYRAVVTRDGVSAGVAIFRVRPRGALWESTLSEVLVPAGEVWTARGLVADVVKAAEVDHVACSFPTGSTAARGALLAGSVKAPGGLMFVTNPLRAVHPPPRELRSWALSGGDVEVF